MLVNCVVEERGRGVWSKPQIVAFDDFHGADIYAMACFKLLYQQLSQKQENLNLEHLELQSSKCIIKKGSKRLFVTSFILLE